MSASDDPRLHARIRAVWPLVLLGFYACLFLFTFREADEDVWGRMAVGRLIVASSEVPKQDVFAYVPTKPLWVDHEWLSGVVFHEVHRRFGGGGLVWLRALVGVAAMALVYAVGRTSGAAAGSVAVVTGCVAVLVLQGFNGVVRAQLFSFFLFTLFWWLLERDGKLVWILVPLTALWANLHGGVVTGLALIAIYALCDSSRRRRLVLLGTACVLATLANPYGVHYWSYLVHALSMPRPEIVEWRAIALLPLLDDLHLKLAALSVIVVLAGAGRRVKLAHLALVLGTLAASLLHVRFAPFLAFAMAVALPPAVEALFERGSASFPRRFTPSVKPLAVAVLLLALLAASVAVAWRTWDGVAPRMTVPADRYPVEAVRWLQAEGASGRLAVYFNWGEYALYHLYPDVLVSVDGRYETVYPDEVVQANWDFTRGMAGGERLLEHHPADFALYPGDSGAARWLETDPRWRRVHSDDLSVLYIKQDNE